MGDADFEDIDLSSTYGSRRRAEYRHRLRGGLDEVDAAVAEHLKSKGFEEGVAAKLALVDSYGEDTYDDHTVIRFTKRLTGSRGPQDYTYAAIKADGCWYTTGPCGDRHTWTELLAWFVRGKYPVESFTVLTETPQG